MGMTMTKKDITRAIIDGDMDAIEALALAFTKAKYDEDGDALTELAETIKTTVREDMARDVIIDLKDFGHHEAAQVVKSNY